MSTLALSYALLAGIVPSFIWLIFWLREDVDHPEPKWMITMTFLAGMLSVILAIFGEKFVVQFLAWDETSRYIMWAAVEEIVKFVVVAIVALHSKWNDEPVDAMIYCITVALGFAAIENTLFILGPLSEGAIAESIVTGSMRFVGATLVHVISSAAIGFALGWSYYRGKVSRFISVLLGVAIAIILHSAFNLTIINTTAVDILKTFAWVWAAAIALIVLFEEVKVVKPKAL